MIKNPHPKTGLFETLLELEQHMADSKENARLRRVGLGRSALFSFDGRTTPVTLQTLQSLFGRKWRVNLTNLLQLGQHCLNKVRAVELDYTLYDPYDFPPFQLSSNETALQAALLMKQRALVDLIAKGLSVGLLAVADETYCFHDDGQCGYARMYWVNPYVMDNLSSIARECKIVSANELAPSVPYASTHCAPCVCQEGVSPQPSSLSLSLPYPPHMQQYSNGPSGKRVPSSIPITQYVSQQVGNLSNEDVIERVVQHYGKLWKKYVAEDDGYKFRVKVKRSQKGNVSKTSIRETSHFACMRVEERESLLTAAWGEQPAHYDVKSSIYRVQYFLNHGVWLDDSIDLYQLMCPEKFQDNEQRQLFKRFAMRFYFARTAGEVKGHIKSKLQFGDLDGEQLTELISRAEPIIEQIFTRMRDVIGKTCSSEIFLHESCIYRAVRQELLRRGYRVAQCYDSFYTDKEVADLATIIEQCAQSYRQDWIAQTQGDSAACVNADEEPHATHTVEELAEVFGQDHTPAQSKINRTPILQVVSMGELLQLMGRSLQMKMG